MSNGNAFCCERSNEMRPQQREVRQNDFATPIALRSAERSEVCAADRRTTEAAEDAVENRQCHLRRRGDFNAERLTVCGEIDDQAGLDAPRAYALLPRLTREVEVRGKGFAVPVCDLEITLFHWATGFAATSAWCDSICGIRDV